MSAFAAFAECNFRIAINLNRLSRDRLTYDSAIDLTRSVLLYTVCTLIRDDERDDEGDRRIQSNRDVNRGIRMYRHNDSNNQTYIHILKAKVWRERGERV